MKMITGFSIYPEVAFCLDLENAPVAVTVAWDDGGIQFREGTEQGCMNGVVVSGDRVRSFDLQLRPDSSVNVSVTFLHKGDQVRHTIGRTKYSAIAEDWIRWVNDHYDAISSAELSDTPSESRRSALDNPRV